MVTSPRSSFPLPPRTGARPRLGGFRAVERLRGNTVDRRVGASARRHVGRRPSAVDAIDAVVSPSCVTDVQRAGSTDPTSRPDPCNCRPEGRKVLVSRPVGGILSTGPSRVAGWAAIHLCGLPEECPCGPTGRRRPLLGLAPGGGCHPPRSPPAMVRSYRTVSPLPVPTVRSAIGGLLSVARSVRSLRPGSRQHPALWSPDLPRRRDRSRRRGHPDDSPARTVCQRRAAGSRRRIPRPMPFCSSFHNVFVVKGRTERGASGSRASGLRRTRRRRAR